MRTVRTRTVRTKTVRTRTVRIRTVRTRTARTRTVRTRTARTRTARTRTVRTRTVRSLSVYPSFLKHQFLFVSRPPVVRFGRNLVEMNLTGPPDLSKQPRALENGQKTKKNSKKLQTSVLNSLLEKCDITIWPNWPIPDLRIRPRGDLRA